MTGLLKVHLRSSYDKPQNLFLWRNKKKIQSNFDGSNSFGTMKICSRQRQFEPRRVTISAIPEGIMEIIVGYLFGVLYYKRMLCVLIRIASSRRF